MPWPSTATSPFRLRSLRGHVRGDEDAAADALDQYRVDGAAPPAQRERLAARMTEDQEIDPELGHELGDDVDRLAHDQVIDDVEPLAREQRVRLLEIRLHVLALVGERDFGNVFAG